MTPKEFGEQQIGDIFAYNIGGDGIIYYCLIYERKRSSLRVMVLNPNNTDIEQNFWFGISSSSIENTEKL